MPESVRIAAAASHGYVAISLKTLGTVCAPNFPFRLDNACVASSAACDEEAGAARCFPPLAPVCRIRMFTTQRSRGGGLSRSPSLSLSLASSLAE